MIITDYPKFVNLDEYNSLITKIVDSLSKINIVKNIYQIGHISTLGISDIDLVIIFENDKKTNHNPRENLSKNDRYLIKHGLFGIPQKFLQAAQNYTFFHNYNILFGAPNKFEKEINNVDEMILKKQIALEFLLKMYATIIIQKTYGVIRLRSLFLHVKALQYDFEFLNVKSAKLLDLVNEFIEWRENWFDNKIENQKILDWVNVFFIELEKFLEHYLIKENFYLRSNPSKINNFTNILKSKNLSYSHRGYLFPTFTLSSKKLYNLSHRFNKFVINVPFSTDTKESIIKEREKFNVSIRNYNKKYLPSFSPLVSSLGPN